MNKFYLLLIFIVFAFAKANSQVVINELDADTPSTDFEEFIELRTPDPFTSLDGYIMVLFNGSSSGMGRSYYVEDLNGLTTDVNGLVVLGSSQVRPAVDRQLLSDGNTFQNGADAVAIYLGEPNDFPDRTLANQDNLVAALVYGTNDAENENLLNLLGETVQYNEGAANNTNSLQRKEDGTYEVKAPTPHSLNDATETSYIGVDFRITATEDLNEGDFFSLTFTLTRAADEDFNLSFSLNNGSFNEADYNGTTEIFIPAGQTEQSLDFELINDDLDEGDEFMRVDLDDDLPVGFKRIKDNIEYLVIDDDFTVADYGNPTTPTYGTVRPRTPDGYYDTLEDKAGPELEQAITSIIAETGVVRHHTYADITTILKDADASALNSNKVWLLYSEIERSDVLFQDGSNGNGRWNREHVFPRSRGDYDSLEDLDDIADGINVWVETSVDSLRHGNSDAHHLRATDAPTNSSRGDQNYSENSNLGYNGPSGSQGSWHGDVARSIFYMTLRYNYSDTQMLQVIDGYPENDMGQIGDLETLLQWHEEDPVDDFEMNRNNVVYDWQRNRNPFIDRPELVDFVFGPKAGQAYTLSNATETLDQITVYPNPSRGMFYISNVNEPISLRIFDTLGREALSREIFNNTQIQHNLASGIYLVRLSNDAGSSSKKLIVE
ncbi:Por secretion system C-terminal sorting domain-containing protein [Nonlabens sp. Hel1_33_55]|uniref:endonuclease n=1 Tax=Nonlabens sp. Hel1_33_55 TaxID=1336802 RepID=UPI000875CA34|nr:endonuclease [Nonlabens sp. Hel1_33_55]SCY09859.1 Por secretion system C-terminal sorting domain-containing protein [Nonlabens sp. Hel1_33_55]